MSTRRRREFFVVVLVWCLVWFLLPLNTFGQADTRGDKTKSGETEPAKSPTAEVGPAEVAPAQNAHADASAPATVAPTKPKRGESTAGDAPTCAGSSKKPCVTQPQAEQTKIAGFADPNATVEVTINKVSKGKSTAESDGSFKTTVAALKAGQTVVATQSGTGVSAGSSAPVTVAAKDSTGTSSSLYTLGLFGLNATGTSSSGPSQQYFASFDVMAPVPFLGSHICPKGVINHPLEQKCWVWMNPRIASAPTAASTALSSFTTPASFSSGISSQTISQITQTFEFQGGIEYYLSRPYDGRQFGWQNSWARSSLALIAGLGTVTPFNSTSSASEYQLSPNLGAQFNNNPKLASTYPQLAIALCTYGYTPAGKATACPTAPSSPPTAVAFLLPNRSRFYRDYFVGIRLRTYYFTGACKNPKKSGDESNDKTNEKSSDTDAESNTNPDLCKVDNTYPGTFDVRLGQDETVTGGKLQSLIMTLTGSYPLPGSGGAFRVFASTYLRFHSNNNSTALALVPVTTFVALTNASVVIQGITPPDRDYFRLGVGTDLISLISKWVGKNKSSD